MLASPVVPKVTYQSWYVTNSHHGFPVLPVMEQVIPGEFLSLKLTDMSEFLSSLQVTKEIGFQSRRYTIDVTGLTAFMHIARKSHFPPEEPALGNSLVLVVSQVRLEKCKAPSKL